MKSGIFVDAFEKAAQSGNFIKCSLSRPGTGAEPELKNIYLRPVVIKKQPKIGCTFRYKTRDVVKNFEIVEAVESLRQWLGAAFMNADLFTTQKDYTLSFNKKGEPQLQEKAATQKEAATPVHNREKNRLLDAGRPWLHLLGITNAKGEVLANAQDKWRQINKFLEIIDSLVRENPLHENAHLADMGSGKGYLTFALYDYLRHTKNLSVTVTGIELRPALVDFCNKTASQVGFEGLSFVAEDINQYHPERLDMLIALHACDTATDLALSKGILGQAGIIVVAPCCHKQIRKEMDTQNALSPILRHGILEERQAEIVTDGIRALLLESKGYQTKVFEFISTEHTAKNVMITAVQSTKKNQKDAESALNKVTAIKEGFGIKTHFLETLLP